MDYKRALFIGMTRFLQDEAAASNYSPEVLEHLSVASNCLEMAFNIKENELISTSSGLQKMFEENIQEIPNFQTIRRFENNQKLSDICKAEGNKLMEAGCYEKAIESYTEAINYCKTNSICFCNRAAAFAKLNLYNRAIEDCKAAIKLNNRYSKAYARMGLYFSKLGQLSKAVYCYNMALDIEPYNESYLRNLTVAKMKFSKIGIKSSLSKPGSVVDLNNNRRKLRSSSSSSIDECYHSSTESLDEEHQNQLFDKLAAALFLDSRELSLEDYSTLLQTEEMQELCLEFLSRLRLVDSSFVNHIGHELFTQLKTNSNRKDRSSHRRKNLHVTFQS